MSTQTEPDKNPIDQYNKAIEGIEQVLEWIEGLERTQGLDELDIESHQKLVNSFELLCDLCFTGYNKKREYESQQFENFIEPLLVKLENLKADFDTRRLLIDFDFED